MILVAGATGLLGSEIVRQLREGGQQVRGLVRKSSAPEKISALKNTGVELVIGDLKDRDSLNAACKGADAVISTVTTITTAKAGDSFASTDAAGTIQLIDAAKAAGVGRFIFISFNTEAFPEFPLNDAKRAVEAHLKRSGLSYTILQPSLFMESWLGPMLFLDAAAGTAKIYGDGNLKLSYVAICDVATVTVKSLSLPVAGNAVIPFSGDAVSQREAVAIFEEAYGMTLTPVEVPAAALEQQWSAAQDPVQKTFAGLMLAVARGMGGNSPQAPAEFKLRPATVREFARRQSSQ